MQSRKHGSFQIRIYRLSLAVFLLLGGGCSGGMIGTGTGKGASTEIGTGTEDSSTIYELHKLPERISPDIPKHLETLPAESSSNEEINEQAPQDHSMLLRNNTETIRQAVSWRELHHTMAMSAMFKLNIQQSITLVDLAHSDIVQRCEEETDCIIPATEIRVKYTQPVINRLIKLYTDSVDVTSEIDTQQDNDEYAQEIHDTFSSLLNTEVIFGETHYTKLNGTPYQYQIDTSFLTVEGDTDFNVQWRDDEAVTTAISTIQLNGEEENDDTLSLTIDYFYQSGSPSESVIIKVDDITEDNNDNDGLEIVVKVISNDPTNNGILIESIMAGSGASSSSSSSGAISTIDETTPTVYEEVSSDEETIRFKTLWTAQGQINSDGGYATVENFTFPDETPDHFSLAKYYRETFDNQGNLLAGETCQVDRTTAEAHDNLCDSPEYFTTYGPETARLIDSNLYYDWGKFDSLESVEDAIRWQVVDLPNDISEFAVVAANSTLPLDERKYLCLGYQVVAGDVSLYCTATDEELSVETQVIDLTAIPSIQTVPTARLEQK